MKKPHLLGVISAVVYFGIATNVLASPLYDTFGPLDDATFGGTGIPNDEVAISSQFSNGTSLITVAMSATQRYGNPALTNDGLGTYFAGAGSNTGPGSPAGTQEGALWNFNYYINIDGGGSGETLADYDITLFYDFDPAFDNGPAGLGMINVTNGILGSTDPLATKVEGSENLMFGYLASDIPSLLVAPTYAAFDPNALGEYNFGISVGQSGWGVENVRMDVQVVPVPAAVWLFGSGLLGLVGIARRKKV